MRALKIIGIVLLALLVVVGIMGIIYACVPSFAEWVDKVFKIGEETAEVVQSYLLK